MMSRGNMGKQIATAPASRMAGMARPMMPAVAKAPVMRMAKGGKVSRGDGCCMKGHTKGNQR